MRHKTGLWIAILFLPEIGSCQTWFSVETIDSKIPGAYQVSVADINHDGKPDIAGLSSGAGVHWYENPTWEKRPISIDVTQRNIDLAFHDIDNDGEVEVALGYNFDLNNSKIGSVGILKRTKNINEQWKLHFLTHEPTVHRLRWSDVNQDGKSDIVVAPIIGEGSMRPEYTQTPARQFVLYAPEKPLQYKWDKEIFDNGMHLTHGMFIWDNHILVSGIEGVRSFFRLDGKWQSKQLCTSAPNQFGKSGSSEIVVGHLKKDTAYFATLEPWHGNQVVVYRDNDTGTKFREVLDDSFDNGHALACADFDKDGQDEIIAGYRGKPYGVYIYDFEINESKWVRHAIDEGGLAAQGFFVADINQDGWLDFAGAGGSTQNVKLYLNMRGSR